MKKIIFGIVSVFLYGLIAACTPDDPKTEEAAPVQAETKAESVQSQIESLLKKQPGVENVEMIKQAYINGKELAAGDEKYLAEITLKQNFTWGSAQDWQSLSATLDRIVLVAFAKPEMERLRFKVVGEDDDNKSMDWAYVEFKKSQFPSGWENASFLERFSFADSVSSLNLQTNEALCAFYAEHPITKPKHNSGCFSEP
jgi:hypothetical protein